MISSELESLGRLGESLTLAVEGDRLSPSYLFEGGDTEVAHRLARAFAAAVLGSGLDDDARARVERQVEDGTHPDLHIQGRDKATVISVAALTVLLEEAHATPVEGRYQVFLLDPAEAMEPEGIGRYLNALEEPPPTTLFVLVTTQPERLPQTVLSRVRRVRIPPPPPEQVVAALRRDGMAEAAADDLARWSGFSLARARRMAATGTHDVAQDLAAASADAAPRAGAAVDTALASLTREAATAAAVDPDEGVDRKREHLRRLLSDVLFVLAVHARDAAAGQGGTWLSGVDPDRALRLFENLGRLSASIGQNVTPAVVLLESVRVLGDARREPTPR